MKSKIWLSPPHMGGTEDKFVREAFETNWIAPLGPNVNGFENDRERDGDAKHRKLKRQSIMLLNNIISKHRIIEGKIEFQ